MPKYDVTISFTFIGIEAESEEMAREMADDAIGIVKVPHPTNTDDIFSDFDIQTNG
jgi:hypothetical protein